MIKGEFEIIGLEELLMNSRARNTTVKCISQTAQTFFISSESYQKLFLSKCFDDSVVNEIVVQKQISSKIIQQSKKSFKSIVKNRNDTIIEAELSQRNSDQETRSPQAKKREIEFIGDLDSIGDIKRKPNS